MIEGCESDVGLAAFPQLSNDDCPNKICAQPADCDPSQAWTKPDQSASGSSADTVCYHGKIDFKVVFCPLISEKLMSEETFSVDYFYLNEFRWHFPRYDEGWNIKTLFYAQHHGSLLLVRRLFRLGGCLLGCLLARSFFTALLATPGQLPVVCISSYGNPMN
jgi:hypothetical protein